MRKDHICKIWGCICSDDGQRQQFPLQHQYTTQKAVICRLYTEQI